MPWEEDLKKSLKRNAEEELPEMPSPISSVIALIGRNRELGRDEILLMKRTLTVKNHKGQISFPGGYRESNDLDLKETALREAEEEVGVKPEDIQVLGLLEPVKTRGEILIYPWVGKLDFPYPFRLNPAEVDRLVFLPVETLLSQGLKPVHVSMGTFNIKSIGISIDGEMVWGATARMLVELRAHLQRLRSAQPVQQDIA
jgi:8-oxo-dGTP pyrophosphatase MutT (NUDIX family)